MTDLNIYNVEEITKSDIYHSKTSSNKCRVITITTNTGEEIEISLWSKSLANLIIKNED